MQDIIVGIDLGTTNSAIACVRDGRPVILRVDGSPTMPSCVGLSPEGKLLVGREALSQFTVYPERTVRSIKRRMGLDFEVLLGERRFRPEEISSFILGKLKRAAEAELGQPVRRAVITVPAYFDENQRRATRRAGELAGFTVERILNEPTAAAVAYGSNRKEGEKVLVYDLGGGTFDASLVVSEGGVIEVRSSHGDTELGGDDFDEMLVRRAGRAFVEAGGVDPLADAVARNRLTLLMERTKITLSSEPFARVEEAFFHEGKNLLIELARQEYEEEIHAFLEKTIGCCAQCLHDASMRATELDRILLVGGSSRTPLVRTLIAERFGCEPRHEIDPDLIVALGAALQAAAIGGDSGAGILVDITPYNLGIEALQGPFSTLEFATIIPRNTPLPASHAELFDTVHDDQEEVRISVRQGPGETLEENHLIGAFLVEGLSKGPAGSPIVVRFQLNLNGMLEVTAIEKRTGLSKSVTLDTAGGTTVEGIDAARERLGEWAVESPVATGNATPNTRTAATLRERAKGLLAIGEVESEDRSEIEELLARMGTALKAEDNDAFEEASNELEDILFYLEE